MALLRERITELDEVGDLAAEPGSRAWAVAVRGKLHEHLHDSESSALALREYADAMVRFEGFRQLTDASGFPFRTFEAFCRERSPFGLGYDPAAIERIVEERRSAQVRAQAPLSLLDPGPPTKEERDDKGYDITVRGTGSDYLTARIARDRPDILKRMQAGEFPSVRAAAREAGLVKQEFRAPLTVEGIARGVRKHFTPEQIDALVEALTREA